MQPAASSRGTKRKINEGTEPTLRNVKPKLRQADGLVVGSRLLGPDETKTVLRLCCIESFGSLVAVNRAYRSLVKLYLQHATDITMRWVDPKLRDKAPGGWKR